MASLFDLRDGQVVLNAESLAIPIFNKIWKRDKSKDKEKANREIAYIYFMCDFNSPYMAYPNTKRREVVLTDFMRDVKWKEDKEIEDAMSKYLEFQETHTMRLMKAARGAADKLASYFEHIDFREMGENGKPLYNAKDVAINLEKVGSIVESLDKLENKIKKEIKSDSRVRGGGDIGLYER
tara:strand:+ start:636 stop:1178 length:543 start_codon:yes stop_codon:yes gene_type:complete